MIKVGSAGMAKYCLMRIRMPSVTRQPVALHGKGDVMAELHLCSFKATNIMCSVCGSKVKRSGSGDAPRWWYENGYCQAWNDELNADIHFAVCPTCKRENPEAVSQEWRRANKRMTFARRKAARVE